MKPSRLTTSSQTWTAVDAYTISHLHPPSKKNSAVLLDALTQSRDEGLPDIASYPVIAKFYALQCRAMRVKHALEIGTLGAYTSIFLATENPGMQITTIEVDPHHYKVAQQNVAHAGVLEQVTAKLGAALDVLPELAKEIESGGKPRLGFVYIDADKSNNWKYVDVVIPMCESGAVIFVDNIVRGGDLVDRAKKDASTAGSRRVVEMVGKDDRLDGVVLQTVGEKSYDGILMAVVR
ncbi:S-adenosyl-L-methionine-dependent methyltransferase [Neohortaea acidophila]|uniref:S-adenosyl-L-methionine-dependent methyltransferase n=1 Tax=Neohortaea acidophila TaxID=245834 RepID=A0A6A6PYH9_9PEZI|nr:S-adenosyl-L-methionine-dependent methyltransferase [Neohortaea acidophila]KAF2484523.1 S-adenosyl-L-methionine-dependent methyltransferase [Neohortaea acidophila]